MPRRRKDYRQTLAELAATTTGLPEPLRIELAAELKRALARLRAKLRPPAPPPAQ